MKYFRLAEFDSPDSPGTGAKMDPSFLEMLDTARGWVGLPFRITSGFRTPSHNQVVGGVPNSSHCKGYASDISIYGWQEADVVRLIANLVKVGFRRIGRAKTFVHVDSDPDKKEAYWDYSSGDHKA